MEILKQFLKIATTTKIARASLVIFNNKKKEFHQNMHLSCSLKVVLDPPF